MKFRNSAHFQSYLRSHKWIPDDFPFIRIGKKLYTLYDYDIEGRYVSWGNKRYNRLIKCLTKNRHLSTKNANVMSYSKVKLLKDNINYYE